MNAAALSARNLLRNRFRTVLTVAGVAVAIVTFITLRTVVYAWTVATEVAPKDRVVTRNKVSFVVPLPKRHFDRVQQVPGVKKSTFANWFGGRDPRHESEFFASMAVDTHTVFDVYTEMQVPPDQLQAWKDDRNGAIVGDALAGKLGWKIGDRVTLESGIYYTTPDNPWTFTIRGIYTATARSVDRSTFMFHWQLLNERQSERDRDYVGWVVSRVTDPSRAADICQAIDRMFDDSDMQTLSQDERSFNASFLASFSAVLKAIDIVSVAILVIMMLILGNTIAMGVRERTNEYGVLRALGFSRWHLGGLVLGESLAAGVLGSILGLAVAYPFVEGGLGRWLEENMGAFFPFFRIDPVTAVSAAVLAVALSGIAAILPAWQVTQLRVVDALRRIG